MSLVGGDLPTYVLEKVPTNTCCRVYGLIESYVFIISSDNAIGCIALKSTDYDKIKINVTKNTTLIVSEFGDLYYLSLSSEQIKHYKQLFLEVVNIVNFNLSPTPVSPHPGELKCDIIIPVGPDCSKIYSSVPGGIGVYQHTWDATRLKIHKQYGVRPDTRCRSSVFCGVVDVTRDQAEIPKLGYMWLAELILLVLVLCLFIRG